MYDQMPKGKKEAMIGLGSEQYIVDLINNDENFRRSIDEALGVLGIGIYGPIHARNVEDTGKIDIMISSVGASMKSGKTGWHHLDRRRLESWASILNMPDVIFDIFKRSILRVTKDRNNEFINVHDQDRIKGFLEPNIQQMIHEVFDRNDEDLLVFMVYNTERDTISLFRMDEMLEHLITSNIHFSKKGIVCIGDFITIQRKGGDGNVKDIPKSDWLHPCNQLQFKLKAKHMALAMERSSAVSSVVIRCPSQTGVQWTSADDWF